MRYVLWACWIVAGLMGGSPAAQAQLRWETWLQGGETWCLTVREGQVWAGTGSGVKVYRSTGGQVTVQDPPMGVGGPAGAVSALAFREGVMWVGTRYGTIGRLEADTGRWAIFDQRTGVPEAGVTALVDDGLDVWASTAGGGVARFNVLRQDWEVYTTSEGLPSADVRALVADSSGLWAGTAEGLARYDRALFRWQPVAPRDGLEGPIEALACSEHYLWIGSRTAGLSRIDLASGAFSHYDLASFGVGEVQALAISAAGDLWVATAQGLLRVPQEDRGEQPWTVVEKALPEVTALQAADSELWVATQEAGVWRYRIAGDHWEQYAPKEALPAGEVTTLAIQAGGSWVGFAGGGLARYDLARGRWDSYDPPAGLPRQVRQVAVFDRWVYCACSDGILVLDTEAGTWTARTVGYEPDLLGDDWTSVVATGTAVWFAGPGRVALFSPEMELQTTFQFAGLDADAGRTLPQLRRDAVANTVWVYGREGAWVFQPSLANWSEFPASLFEPAEPGAAIRAGRLLRDLACDAESVWFLGLGQVRQYRRETNELWAWDNGHARDLLAAEVLTSRRNQVWLAGPQAVYAYRRDRPGWIVYSLEGSGLAGSRPTAIAVDEGEPYVWLASAVGVARLELGGNGSRWQTFGPEAGIVPEVRQIVSGPHAVWFIGRNGLTLYRRAVSTEAAAR